MVGDDENTMEECQEGERERERGRRINYLLSLVLILWCEMGIDMDP